MECRKIKFYAWVGDRKFSVSIEEVPGGGGIWYIMIDKRFYGQIARIGNDKWRVNFHRAEEWTWADCMVLEEIVSEHVKSVGK